jgi:hypothetical protein
MSSSARKWMELNWLRKGNKEIPLPEIVFECEKTVGGYYSRPARKEKEICGRFYDLSKGLISINPRYDQEFILNTIAHEWRHHWQRFMGISNPNPSPFESAGNYDEDIVRFFKGSWWEMDALLFSIKKAPDETSMYWIDLLRREHENENMGVPL